MVRRLRPVRIVLRDLVWAPITSVRFRDLEKQLPTGGWPAEKRYYKSTSKAFSTMKALKRNSVSPA